MKCFEIATMNLSAGFSRIFHANLWQCKVLGLMRSLLHVVAVGLIPSRTFVTLTDEMRVTNNVRYGHFHSKGGNFALWGILISGELRKIQDHNIFHYITHTGCSYLGEYAILEKELHSVMTELYIPQIWPFLCWNYGIIFQSHVSFTITSWIIWVMLYL